MRSQMSSAQSPTIRVTLDLTSDEVGVLAAALKARAETYDQYAADCEPLTVRAKRTDDPAYWRARAEQARTLYDQLMGSIK